MNKGSPDWNDPELRAATTGVMVALLIGILAICGWAFITGGFASA